METWQKVMCVVVVLCMFGNFYDDGYEAAEKKYAKEEDYYDSLLKETREYYEYEEIQPLEERIKELEQEIVDMEYDHKYDLEEAYAELESLQEQMDGYFNEMAWVYFDYAEQPMQWNGEEISNDLLEKLAENY